MFLPRSEGNTALNASVVHRFQVSCIVLALTSVGCLDSASPAPPLQICEETFKVIPMELQRDLDILFVIDSAPSMADERDSLTVNLRRFASVLEHIEGGLPNVHIGFVTADMGVGPYPVPGCTERGDDGRLHDQARIACLPPADPYLIDVAYPNGVRRRNFHGSLADAMTCIAPVDSDGCRFSRPLAAIRRALDGSHPQHAGFLRARAFLLVVIITDQDDCSTRDDSLFDPDDPTLGPTTPFRCFEAGVMCTPDQPRTPGLHAPCEPRQPSPYLQDLEAFVDFVKSLKDDPGQVVVSIVDGDMAPIEVIVDGTDQLALAPSCQSATGSASPAVRLEHFAARFPQRNQVTSICAEDLSDAMLPVASTPTPSLASPCLEGSIDLDPDTDGLQVECSVTEVYRPDASTYEETVLPRCSSDAPPSGERPCWRIDLDFLICPDTETSATLDVLRSPATVPPGTFLNVRCAAECR